MLVKGPQKLCESYLWCFVMAQTWTIGNMRTTAVRNSQFATNDICRTSFDTCTHFYCACYHFRCIVRFMRIYVIYLFTIIRVFSVTLGQSHYYTRKKILDDISKIKQFANDVHTLGCTQNVRGTRILCYVLVKKTTDFSRWFSCRWITDDISYDCSVANGATLKNII